MKKPRRTSVPREFPRETRAAWFAAAAVSILVLLDWAWWQTGLCFSNEILALEDLQAWIQGQAPALRLGGGGLIRLLQRMTAMLPGAGLGAMHLPVQALFLLECWLLYRMGRKLFNARAAAWSLLALCLAAVTWLRVRNDLPHAIVPAEILGLMALNLACVSPRLAALSGLATGLLCLDYEAWLLALPVLGLSWAESSRAKKLLPYWALGLALGLLAVFELQWRFLPEYLSQRRALTLPTAPASVLAALAFNARAFLLGGPCIPNFGLQNHPAFPLWAWPGLLTGAWLAARQRPWLLFWAALGLAPLALRANALEPNRLVVAWPVLCLLAGAGTAYLLDRAVQRGWKNAPLLALALVLGLALADEGLSFVGQTRADDAYLYGYSRGLMAVADRIHEDFGSRPLTLLADLDAEPCLSLRYMTGRVPEPMVFSTPAALVPWHFAKNLKPSWGSLQLIPTAGSRAPMYLLYPRDAAAARLLRVDQVLRGIHDRERSQPIARRLEVWRQALDSPDSTDPWIRTVCWEKRLDLEASLGMDWRNSLKLAEKEPLESAALLKKAAYRLKDVDPAESLRLITRATQEDARSLLAWQFRLDLLRKLGHADEAARLEAGLKQEGLPFGAAE